MVTGKLPGLLPPEEKVHLFNYLPFYYSFLRCDSFSFQERDRSVFVFICRSHWREMPLWASLLCWTGSPPLFSQRTDRTNRIHYQRHTRQQYRRKDSEIVELETSYWSQLVCMRTMQAGSPFLCNHALNQDSYSFIWADAHRVYPSFGCQISSEELSCNVRRCVSMHFLLGHITFAEAGEQRYLPHCNKIGCTTWTWNIHIRTFEIKWYHLPISI